jgi:hypothetical protein
MSIDDDQRVQVGRPSRHRGYRVALTISIILNLVLAAALYLYSSVESFMSLIGMAVGFLG